jgi:hypothetical protein
MPPCRRSKARFALAQPHDVPRDEALILASNQQIVLGPMAAVRVL